MAAPFSFSSIFFLFFFSFFCFHPHNIFSPPFFSLPFFFSHCGGGGLPPPFFFCFHSPPPPPPQFIFLLSYLGGGGSLKTISKTKQEHICVAHTQIILIRMSITMHRTESTECTKTRATTGPDQKQASQLQPKCLKTTMPQALDSG